MDGPKIPSPLHFSSSFESYMNNKIITSIFWSHLVVYSITSKKASLLSSMVVMCIRVVNDSRIRVGIKAWFVGMGICIGIRWCRNRNQNRIHMLLESKLESESLILVNPGIGIRIEISPSEVGAGIGIIKICSSGIRSVWESHVIPMHMLSGVFHFTDFPPWLWLEKN